MYMFNLLNNGRIGDSTALAVMLFALIMILVLIFRLLVKSDPDV